MKNKLLHSLILIATLSITASTYYPQGLKQKRLASALSPETAFKTMRKSYPSSASMSIESDMTPPALPQKPFSLTAVINANTTISGVLKWKLPEGVRLLSGNINETVSLNAGESKNLTILIEVSNINNHQIFSFFDYSIGPKQNLSASAQFVTNPQALDPIHSTPLAGEVLFAKPETQESLKEIKEQEVEDKNDNDVNAKKSNSTNAKNADIDKKTQESIERPRIIQ
ncbi:MAG: hypothetical protein SGI74_02045 [Oligoflexia bacterium]|nr:hypothetical protein [Oligoflexia bacterium]